MCISWFRQSKTALADNSPDTNPSPDLDWSQLVRWDRRQRDWVPVTEEELRRPSWLSRLFRRHG